jgi:stage II sporulation protein D
MRDRVLLGGVFLRNDYRFMGLFVCLFFFLLPLFIILIPVLLVNFQEADIRVDANPKIADQYEKKISIVVTLSKEDKVVSVPLEDYVRGVVASEMPLTFQPESLRAQALAARTYIISRVKNNRAKVTDTVKDQVYATDEALRQRWGSNYDANMRKITTAVNSTRDMIITYQGKPIYAAFFSTSNGHTENSEDYFIQPYPYLRSVASPWDKQSPKYMRTKTVTLTAMSRQLEDHTGKRIAIATLTQTNGIKMLKRTTGKRIATLKFGDQVFTGREVREALGLASSDFTWSIHGKNVTFTTYGFGHGVGMSQWGANLLAEQGKKAEEIIHHYYRGVAIKKI